MTEVIAALLLALLMCTSNAKTADVNTGYIFLGDSRTVGMNNAVCIDEEDSMFVVAKVGEGYNWMVKTGLPEVVSIIENNTEYNKWVLITNLGVNDLHNKNKYMDAYADIAEYMDVYVVSVNPCKGSYDNLNSKIDSFNEAMKELECVDYIDTCSTLREDGFSSSDGLHYGLQTYEKIYDMIVSGIDELSEK